MLLYYPLEHLSYLLSHSVIPTSVPSPSSFISNIPFVSSFLSSGSSVKLNEVHLDANVLSIWSTRFWAAYVGLQFLHLREDAKLLGRRERSIAKAKGKAGSGGTAAYEVEKAEVRKRWDALLNELVVNLGYLPLTIHWLVYFCLYLLDVSNPASMRQHEVAKCTYELTITCPQVSRARPLQERCLRQPLRLHRRRSVLPFRMERDRPAVRTRRA
jgi:hypothetical protein